MTSFKVRIGLVVGAATVVAGAIAVAQDRPRPAPAGSAGTEVFNSIEGRLVVVNSRPEGARVEKGEVVCELDSTELQDRLAAQTTLIRAREAELDAAGLATEAASLAVPGYVEGGYFQDLQQSERAIKLAESKLVRAEDKLDWCRRMFDKGYASMFEKTADELTLKESRFALELAQTKKKILVEYDRKQTISGLQAEVQAAKARELVKQAELERERLVQKSLASQIARCKVTAPVAGRIHYITPIGPGAVVRDGQLLCRIVPEGAAGIDK
jgi:HlyD family secretion protein